MARIRFAVRNLARSPLLSLVVMASLGLGIGANTAIFSLLRQIVLSSLPVPHPEELVLLKTPADIKGGRNSTSLSGGMDSIFSYPMFRGLEKKPAGFQGLAAFRDLDANIAVGNQTVHADMLAVSGDYFSLLGVKPAIGRTIERADDVPGAGNAVAILSYGFWRDQLSGRADVLNQPIRVNGNALTVAGVAPQGFNGITLGDQPAIYVPLSLKPKLTPGWDGTARYDDFYLYLFGRLKPGVTTAQAQAAINTVYPDLRDKQIAAVKYGSKTAERIRKSRITLTDGARGQSGMRDDSRTPLFILICATAMVLLIAIANAANLLLARSAQRRRELSIRAAMGASRTELMAEMLTEAMLLSAGGAVAGIAIGLLTLRFLVASMNGGGDQPIYYLNTTLDWGTLAYSAGLALITGILAGLYPAFQASRAGVAGAMQAESGRSSSSRGASLVRTSLVCAQVAISAALLIPTGLLLKSLVNLMRVDLGMRTESIAQFTVSPQLNGYSFPQCAALLDRMETDLAGIPGVRSVASALVPLLGDSNWGSDVHFLDASQPDSNARFNEINGGYFAKMGVPLIGGREFTNADTAAAPRVVIVNQEFVRKFYDGKSALGRRISQGSETPFEIVGVVRNNAYSGVKNEPLPIFYIPWRQDKQVGQLSFYVRSALPMEQMMPQIRRAVHNLDAQLPIEDLRTLDEQVSKNVQNDRLILQLSGAFAGLATLLAMLGLYGVMAFSVARRAREIGIRVALGAAPARIRLMVMRQMLVILAVGLAIGIPVALSVSKYTKSQLFGVQSFDWPTLIAAVCALTGAAAVAGMIPARKAARLDPAGILRSE